MRAVKFSLLFFALVTYSYIVNGQAYKWKSHFGNYSIDQGLPSQETYDVVTDSSGFLYISTDRGIVRFDGKEFLSVGFASSQKDYTLFKFTKLVEASRFD